MKSEPEYLEGPEARERFDRAMKHVITVSHDELQRRLKKARRKAARNPNKRGSKPGVLNHTPKRRDS